MSVTSDHSPVTSARARRVRSIRSLHRGDTVEARSGGTTYFRGEIQDTAPGLATVWIRDESTGLRSAASMDDFSIWKV
ncbi:MULTISPECIES: hypothetical protein [unclassified Arthrobacter]|uniref:hypothetical protein n=1 Tax=unclassified Arthrobacter TaxID=235627 RepID=UPI001E50C2D8|nr:MULTISPECIES: hypothetical protein [unclassified Arthrobacter]MCC9144583.1 hypothetical protein [Arthrobacter sp. zg-Y919]MDK1275809.1 hypothetical protein [Arthrobacter sp. zg.Y919]MDM7991441.1 hypothetical protein [Arthrobacter sp. zg-Y877]WIB02827.1 hypothetical protein QNO10_12925 [Arthrobacter sp. zg-Y919]